MTKLGHPSRLAFLVRLPLLHELLHLLQHGGSLVVAIACLFWHKRACSKAVLQKLSFALGLAPLLLHGFDNGGGPRQFVDLVVALLHGILLRREKPPFRNVCKLKTFLDFGIKQEGKTGHRKLPRHCTICFALETARSVSSSFLPFLAFMAFMLFMGFGGFGSSGLAPGLASPPG